MIKVGFVLLSPVAAPIPSTRVAVLNMFPFLHAAGFDPSVVFDPAIPSEQPALALDADRLLREGYRIVCFQKVSGPSVLAAVDALAARGIKTVYLVCDLVEAAMARATDATVAVTEFLASLYPADVRPKVSVVHDGIERPELEKHQWRDDRGSRARPLRAVLVTSAYLETLPVLGRPPPWLHVTVMGRYPAFSSWLHRLHDAQWHVRHLSSWRERRAAVRFLVDRRTARTPWHPDGVYEALRRADIGIIPIDTPPASDAAPGVANWMVKSENRLTLKMSIGLPVIATPIPAYLPVVEQGVNGHLASNRGEWFEALEALRDPALRRSMGAAARRSVAARYSKEAQAQRLVAVLNRLIGRE